MDILSVLTTSILPFLSFLIIIYQILTILREDSVLCLIKEKRPIVEDSFNYSFFFSYSIRAGMQLTGIVAIRIRVNYNTLNFKNDFSFALQK